VQEVNIIFVCVLVLCAQVNMMFVMFVMFLFFGVMMHIHTGQTEKLAWPRWESNPQPLQN
jgi:hypothetical protein